MISIVPMFCPEALNDAIARAVNQRASSKLLSPTERSDLVAQFQKQAEQWWYRDGRQISIQVDFEANTCSVVPTSDIPF